MARRQQGCTTPYVLATSRRHPDKNYFPAQGFFSRARTDGGRGILGGTGGGPGGVIGDGGAVGGGTDAAGVLISIDWIFLPSQSPA